GPLGLEGESSGISTSGTCTIHSHTDCSTFDGVLFRFMTPCYYMLAETCSPTEALPMFSVEVANEQDRNSSLTTIQQVTVNVGEFRVSLLKRQTYRVVVNGVWKKLPLNIRSGTVNIKGNPAGVLLKTSFGLSVSYDNTGAVHVTLPSTYAGKICGMCGNFNHFTGDDLRKPNGASSCDTILVPHQCDPQQEVEYASEPYCGGLLSNTGPFAECQSVLGAESYYRSCVVSMCTAHGDPAVLCETLQAYADICQEAGVNVPTWRNSTFCSLQCGENSHYNSCANGCPEVCSIMDISGSCESCEERCECDYGFKLSGGKCVPTEDCGCWYNGKHYEKGETTVEGECVQQCHCTGNNEMQCTSMQCAHDEVCKVMDGVKGCFPFKPATCSVYGDPHYITFDGMAYDFQGGCSYTLTTTCGGETSVQFAIIGHNIHPPLQNFTRSKLEAVTLQVEDLNLTLNQSGEISVNNSHVWLPYVTNGTFGSVKIYLNNNYITLETTFGLQLMIDGQNRLFLQVDEHYKYELCGLCGTYSGHQGDDFITPGGQNATEPFEFGDSWRVQNINECTVYPNDPRVCDLEEEDEAYNECYTLLGDAFKPCHELIHPSIYLSTCVYDYCATNGEQYTLCESLKSYAAACQIAGLELPPWQSGTACADPPTTATSPTTTTPTSPTPDQTFCPLNCDFEKNLCGWEQLIQDSFDWTRHTGPTPSNLTGPNQDHTTGAGFYIYIEGTSVTHGDSARLLSSVCQSDGPLCLHFWYHMYGSATAMALNIYMLKDNKVTKVWSRINNRGPEWHEGYIDINVSGPFKIILEGIRGSNAQSDMAIDDISIHFGSCSDSFPGLISGTIIPSTTEEVLHTHPVCQMDCDFEQNLCEWSQMATDAFDWKRESGSSPTVMTGPSSDHTTGTGSGHYLYIEDSSVTHGDTARLISSGCSDSGPLCLQFWYHMYGSSDTMGLDVYLYQDGQADGVWGKRNDQGNMWQLAQVDITATGVFQIIFEGQRSNDQSDVAIDDVSLHYGQCEDLVKPTNTASVGLDPVATDGPELLQVNDLTPNAPSCPENSHYTTCVPVCSPTCTHLNGPPHCSDSNTCVSGCVCDDGFVKHVQFCVPIQHCGCVDRNGSKHQFNEAWYTNHCSQKCECEQDDGVGKIDCADKDECDGNGVCLQNDMGNFYCQPTAFSECTIKGDPEYKTFDKLKHDFDGEQSYVLVRTSNLPNNVPDVYVEGIITRNVDDEVDNSQQHRDSSSEEDYALTVRDEEEDDDSEEHEQHHRLQLKIRVYNHTVEFKRHRRLIVDGRLINTPLALTAGLKIQEHSSRIYLKTDFGLSVEYDGHSLAEIILPHIYKRKVGGLCGNFDGQLLNDLMKPDGTRARNVQEFGESWKV
uniref:Zonadhesin n=1 Tax=Anabas testudineus TaxID=64144 RepID=A0A3Q1IHI7_ANATE